MLSESSGDETVVGLITDLRVLFNFLTPGSNADPDPQMK